MDESQSIVVVVDSDLEDIIPIFLESKKKEIVNILDSLDRNDYENIKIMGHKWKGTGAGYGFQAISDIGIDLEKAAKEESGESIHKLMEKLSDYLKHVKVVYSL